MATPNVLILEANSLRENPCGPKGLNTNQFFKDPIQIDGYYFVSSGKPGLGYEYDEKFCELEKAGMNQQSLFTKAKTENLA